MNTSELRLTSVKPVCRIISGTHVRHGLHRFRAEISSMQDGWQESAIKAMGGDVRLGVTLHTPPDNAHVHGIHILDGWCKAEEEQYVVANEEFASTVQQMGLVHTASNMYMDSDEVVWRIHRKNNGSIVITKDVDADDITQLLEKASAYSGTPENFFTSPIDVVPLPAKVLFANRNGELDSGIVHTLLDGHPQLASCLTAKNRKLGTQPVILHPLQVVVAEHWEGQKPGNDKETLAEYKKEVSSTGSKELFSSLYAALQDCLVCDGYGHDDGMVRAMTISSVPIDWEMGDRLIARQSKNEYCLGTVVGTTEKKLSVLWDASDKRENISRKSKKILGRASNTHRQEHLGMLDEHMALAMVETCGNPAATVNATRAWPTDNDSYMVVVKNTAASVDHPKGQYLAHVASASDFATLQHIEGQDVKYLVVNNPIWRSKLPAYKSGDVTIKCDVLSSVDMSALAEDTQYWTSKRKIANSVEAGDCWKAGGPKIQI